MDEWTIYVKEFKQRKIYEMNRLSYIRIFFFSYSLYEPIN